MRRVQITYGDKEDIVDGEQFIIATGSEPTELPLAPFDGKWILNSSHAMSIDKYTEIIINRWRWCNRVRVCQYL